jgi:hypothetical protein
MKIEDSIFPKVTDLTDISNYDFLYTIFLIFVAKLLVYLSILHYFPIFYFSLFVNQAH